RKLKDRKKVRLGQNNIPVSFFAKNNQIIACNFYSINAFQSLNPQCNVIYAIPVLRFVTAKNGVNDVTYRLQNDFCPALPFRIAQLVVSQLLLSCLIYLWVRTRLKNCCAR